MSVNSLANLFKCDARVGGGYFPRFAFDQLGLLEPLVGVKCTRTICHRLNAALAEALKECMKPAQDLTRENIRHRNSPNDSGNEARPIVGLRKRAGG